MLGYLFFAAAFGAIGAISTSLQNGPNLTMFLVFPAMFPFFMIGTFVESPDATLPVLLSLFPLTAPVAMVMRLTVSTVPISELLLSVALLAAFDVLVIWFAGRLFRANSLLAGQLPKLRDVPKLLFGS